VGLLTVTNAATGTFLLEGIDGCDTQKTKIPGFDRRLVARTIENVVPRPKGYFFFNVENGHRFFSPLRH
jgi:hypothetical protein